jgi:SAM-dependent methyltransferase
LEQCLLTRDEILAGYRELIHLYPYIPSAMLWRAWEFAAYRRYTLPEPVLDIGCGDGHFFRLVWPDVTDVIGIDHEPGAVIQAQKSGIYREVHRGAAQALPFDDQAFASAFANCSLEHMDDLPEVLWHIHRCLRPGGIFLLSVVTDKFVDWTALPALIKQAGAVAQGETLQRDYLTYHHLVNALPPQAWASQLANAGLKVEHHVPIVPELTGRLFLFIDQLWHFKSETGEWGDQLPILFATWPNFTAGLKDVLRGVLLMERNWQIGCGAVFRAHKPA